MEQHKYKKTIIKYITYYYIFTFLNYGTEITKDILLNRIDIISNYLLETVKIIFLISLYGGTWFLSSLMFAQFIFYISHKKINSIKTTSTIMMVMRIVTIIYASFGNVENIFIKIVCRALIGGFFLIIGYLIFDKINKIKDVKLIYLLIPMLIYIISTISNNEVNILRVVVNNPILFILNALVGSIILILISKKNSYTKSNNKIRRLLEKFGNDSIIILGTHMPIIALIRIIIEKILKNFIVRNKIVAIITILMEYIILRVYRNIRIKLKRKRKIKYENSDDRT